MYLVQQLASGAVPLDLSHLSRLHVGTPRYNNVIAASEPRYNFDHVTTTLDVKPTLKFRYNMR